MARLTHVDKSGGASMVDVGRKRTTTRRAVATGQVHFNEEAFKLLRENRLSKGDALATARLAGIVAAKRTSDWIPLCHNVPLDRVAIEIDLDEEHHRATVTATASARWKTGVEMEALVAVSAACLTLYDMAKSADRGIHIDEVRLLTKSGGRSGKWSAKTSAR